MLDVTYTGLDPQQITVQVPAGELVAQDVELTSVVRYGQGAEVVTLDPFTVSSSRETDGQAITINEQRVSTKFNAGAARVTGVEFNIRHSLRHFGGWGERFNVFVNGTKLKLEGAQDASFSVFTPESLNWGFSYSRRPFMFMAKWNYRGKRSLAAFPCLGPGAFRYDDRPLILDLNAEFQLRKSIFVYVAAQNVINAPSLEKRYGPETPIYATDHRWGYNGVGITMGVKGTF